MNSDRIPLKLRVLTPMPRAMGTPQSIFQGDDVPTKVKHVVFQAHPENKGLIFIGDNAHALANGEGLIVSHFQTAVVFDVDSDRRIFIDLSCILMHGQYKGDRLIVGYLEEGEI